MDDIADSVANGFIENVREKFAERGGYGRLIFSQTLTEADEVAQGPQVLRLLEERLAEQFPSADIDLKGYPASGYNIQANINIPK